MMLSITRVLAPLVSLLVLSSISTANETPDTLKTIKNFRQPSANHYAAGQPTATQYSQLAAAGIKHIISFRPFSETPELDEQSLSSAAGISFHHIPIAGPTDFNMKNILLLDNTLANIGNNKVLLHCASSNRVGAMMALRANWLQNSSKVQAIQIGMDYGMTGLKPTIESIIDNSAATFQ
jgi:protein tyrosine phosphatase (PTP) superfamily phosphohydrolase (DUF442 family)